MWRLAACAQRTGGAVTVGCHCGAAEQRSSDGGRRAAVVVAGFTGRRPLVCRAPTQVGGGARWRRRAAAQSVSGRSSRIVGQS